MKNKKGLIVGIIILVLLLGAYFLLRYLNLDEEDTAARGCCGNGI